MLNKLAKGIITLLKNYGSLTRSQLLDIQLFENFK